MFKYNAENFTYCWPITMKLITNHNLITFNINDTSGEQKDFENSNRKDWNTINTISAIKIIPKWRLSIL